MGMYFEVGAALVKDPANRELRREFNELKKYQDFLEEDYKRVLRRKAMLKSRRALAKPPAPNEDDCGRGVMSNGDLRRDSLREGTMRQINLMLSLAFLAPQLVKTAVESRLPRGINIERLRDPDPKSRISALIQIESRGNRIRFQQRPASSASRAWCRSIAAGLIRSKHWNKVKNRKHEAFARVQEAQPLRTRSDRLWHRECQL